MPLARVTPLAPADPRPRALIVGASDGDRGVIEHQLGESTRVVGAAPAGPEAMALTRDPGADLVLVSIDLDPAAGMESARQLAQAGYPVVVVSRDRNPDHIVRAMRAGARDFAYLEQPGDVRRAVAALRARAAEQAGRRGRLIAVVGAKGGTGATTLALNLARAVGTPGRRTVLVDLDVERGDALVFLDLAGGFGWHDLLRDLARLDDELFDRSLLRHKSGLRVLAETAAIEDAEPLPPLELARALGRVLEHADWVVVDGIHDFGDTALAVLDLADTIVLAVTQDVPALKNASRSLAVFRRLGYGPDKVKVVVNRYLKKSALKLDAIADALRVPVVATVANDFPTVHAAIDAGELLVDLAPRAQVTRDVQALAALLAPAGGTP